MRGRPGAFPVREAPGGLAPRGGFALPRVRGEGAGVSHPLSRTRAGEVDDIVAGIVDAMGLRNDRDARVRWVLEQRRGPAGVYRVEVAIDPLQGPA